MLTQIMMTIMSSLVIAANSTDRVVEHMVIYDPLPPSPEYKSNDSFNPRGMEHVYFLTNTFLDLIQRDKVLPSSINTSSIVIAIQSGPTESVKFLTEHWDTLLLQYIGLLTVATVGILLAVLLPLIGFFFCCCCCGGRCGAQPDTFYDKKGDGCRRMMFGLLLSLFVIAALFGTVCSFVTNHYTYSGWNEVSGKVNNSLGDAGAYFEHSGKSVDVLLVTNFKQLEEVVNNVLDDSGPILKKKLALITEAIAIDNLDSIVSGLGRTKTNLKDIQRDTIELDEKVKTLQTGLGRSQKQLLRLMDLCSTSQACSRFLSDYNLERDLALADKFISINFKVPELTKMLSELSDVLENNIEKKVKVGKEKFDRIEKQIEDGIEDIKPQVKKELRNMGVQLSDRNSEIQSALRDIDFRTLQRDVPQIDSHTLQVVEWRYYVGLGMASVILLILFCFILGLFYGMCGRRPGSLYGEECCNKGTGANFLATGVYFTFLFSFPLLILTTCHFFLGAAVEKAICETLHTPHKSDIFTEVDRDIFQPMIGDLVGRGGGSISPLSAAGLISNCHNNNTLYNILRLEHVYNISDLHNWRQNFRIGKLVEKLQSEIQLESQLANIELLTPQTRRELEDLARSSLSNIDFSRFTDIIETEMTKIDLRDFVRRLRILKEQVGRVSESVADDIAIEASYLQNLNIVVGSMKVKVRHLKESVVQLQKNSRFNKTSLGVAVTDLITQTDRATKVIRKEGPTLVRQLSQQFVSETAGLVDEYVDRVVKGVRGEVGYCAPLSTSYNATVVAVCKEVVEPFNGFWASIGWCFLLYIPCIAISVSLISLYRKTESYPGPLVEAEVQPLDTQGGHQKKRRGHRRQASSHLPDVSHTRRALPATPNEQPHEYSHARYRDRERRHESGGGRNKRDSREGPPRYTSNPHLVPGNAPEEYDKPPPYYFPGQTPPGGSKK